MNHSDIINEIGAAVVAQQLGVPVEHVRVWKNRGIPRARFAEIITAFPAVSLERLRAGKVPAASLCPELADEHAFSPTDATAPVEPDPVAAVALEKSGVSQ